MTTTTDPDYMTTYRETWADLVETDGQLDRDKVARELADYHHLLCEVPLAYDALTGGRISKPHTDAVHVGRAAADYANRLHAAALLVDLLPQITHEADRQAVIDYVRDLDAGAYEWYLQIQEQRKAVER